MFNSFFGGGFEIIFSLMFVLISGMFIVSIVRSVSQWHKNNNSPRLTVQATVTSTMVERMHTLASPTAFCFMRYSRPETAVKCRGW